MGLEAHGLRLGREVLLQQAALLRDLGVQPLAVLQELVGGKYVVSSTKPRV